LQLQQPDPLAKCIYDAAVQQRLFCARFVMFSLLSIFLQLRRQAAAERQARKNVAALPVRAAVTPVRELPLAA
jgi:hypothetical protein